MLLVLKLKENMNVRKRCKFCEKKCRNVNKSVKLWFDLSMKISTALTRSTSENFDRAMRQKL